MIRVLLAEDILVRGNSLADSLEPETDIDVVASVTDGAADVVATATAGKPDVAVIDITMPGLAGLPLAVRLHRALPQCRTLVVTTDGRPANLGRDADEHVSGFVPRDARGRELAEAIRAAAAGRKVVGYRLAYSTVNVESNPLTRHEIEVLRQVAEGTSARAMAKRLRLSRGVVRDLLASSVAKLEAHDPAGATRIAAAEGWL
ncbi:hypothetical protein BAY61_14645 [Prauserella marina]|uniref:Two-component system, NarL family, response regulator DesR n=1 Tax=Prauserella marina TaxID=530584 RepID=A0A222VQ27_9PSEU|nr:response regulator transcription factor [Prauserella marina]ASR36036.1 hypothetical protein BAY61_14645 [Prauserella marina]PWV84011.1 two-component system response regulator DesR [Prauserella marina]SDC32534.1 two-component system, NarL family, response regulator DesR [Prauserella marina]